MTERRLLLAGAVAGPLFIGSLTVQGLLRTGFRFPDHPPSALELGRAGIVGQATFVCAGLLLVAGSVGLRRAGFRRWAPRLVAVLGCALAAAGLFTMDPAFGFPPGTPGGVGAVTWHAALHGALFPIGFLALLGAANLIGNHYGRNGRRFMQVLTYASAASSFMLSMWPNMSQKPDGRFLPMWFGVTIGYLWISLVFADALRGASAVTAPTGNQGEHFGPEADRNDTLERALASAEGWIRAWNHREVETALAYFADHAVFTSLNAKRVVPSSNGVIRGKHALRNYWSEALPLRPKLLFELLDVFVGVDTIALQYTDEGDRCIVEVFEFEDGKIVNGHATQNDKPRRPVLAPPRTRPV